MADTTQSNSDHSVEPSQNTHFAKLFNIPGIVNKLNQQDFFNLSKTCTDVNKATCIRERTIDEKLAIQLF